jgi:hypothetical protein
MSQSFSAGRHTVLLTLGDGATVERVRFELKKSAPADYVATLTRLGFDPGPDGPVARGRALDAARFVRDQRRSLATSLCGDEVFFEETPPALPTQVASVAETPGGPQQPPPQPPGLVDPPIGPPVLPPQPPGSPTQPTGGGL